MCSEPSAAVVETPAARCLLCNVGCPVRIRKGGPDRYLPDSPARDAGYAGLCGRGSVLADLLDHPDRLLNASRCTAGGCQEIGLAAAMQEAAAALEEKGAAPVSGFMETGAVPFSGRAKGTVPFSQRREKGTAPFAAPR